MLPNSSYVIIQWLYNMEITFNKSIDKIYICKFVFGTPGLE